MAAPGNFWNRQGPLPSTGVHRAIVGDPQADGGPNPELVEADGPIRVTPLRNLSPHQMRTVWAAVPHYADGTDDDDVSAGAEEGDDDDDDENSVPPPAPPDPAGDNSGSSIDPNSLSYDLSAPSSPDDLAGDSGAARGSDPSALGSSSARENLPLILPRSGVMPSLTNLPRETLPYFPDRAGSRSTQELLGMGSSVTDTDPISTSNGWPHLNPPGSGAASWHDGDDLNPPPFQPPSIHTDDDSYLQPPADNGQSSTVSGTPSGGQAPVVSTSWSAANAQRNAAHPIMRSSVAPQIPGPSVNDVLDMGQSAHYTPEQTANLIKAWHRQAVDYAQKNGSGQGYFAGAMQADRDAQNALDTLRQFSGHPDDEANPSFAIPRQPTSATPIYGSDGQPVAYFQPRFRKDGFMDVLVNVPDQAGGPGHSGMLNVPAVTYTDIVNAAKKAALDHAHGLALADEAARTSAQVSGRGDEGYGGDYGESFYRSAANDAALRSDQLSKPQNAFALLTSERAADALRQSSLAEHVGQGGFTGLAQSFYTPIVGMVYNGAATMLDAVGDTAGRDRARQDFRDFRAAAPGYSYGDFKGGWSAVPGQAASVLGSVAPVVLSGPYAPITAGLQTAGSSDTRALDAADELRQKAQQAQSAGDSATAQLFQKQADDIEKTRGLYTALSTALAVGGGAAIPKLARGATALQAAGRGAAEMSLITGAQDQLDRGFLNQSMSPGQAATQILMGAGMGGTAKAFESRAPAPGRTEAPSDQTFPALRDAQGRVTVDGDDASFHSAGGDFQSEIPPPAPSGPNAHLAISAPGDGSGAGSGEAVPPAPLKTEDGSSDVFAKPMAGSTSPPELVLGLKEATPLQDEKLPPGSGSGGNASPLEAEHPPILDEDEEPEAVPPAPPPASLAQTGGVAGHLVSEVGEEQPVFSEDADYPRVKKSKRAFAEIWERSKVNGKVYDPTGTEIKPGDPWQAGHRPEHKFSEAQKRARSQEWDSEMWKKYQRDPDTYRPEKPSTNSGHQFEHE